MVSATIQLPFVVKVDQVYQYFLTCGAHKACWVPEIFGTSTACSNYRLSRSNRLEAPRALYKTENTETIRRNYYWYLESVNIVCVTTTTVAIFKLYITQELKNVDALKFTNTIGITYIMATLDGLLQQTPSQCLLSAVS